MTEMVDELADQADVLNERIGALGRRMGVVVVTATEQTVVATMPVEGNTQPYGLLHGGASVVLAETVGSALAVLATRFASTAVGLEINASHLAAARSGQVTATATILSMSPGWARIAIDVHDDDGVLVCVCRLTCGLRERRS